MPGNRMRGNVGGARVGTVTHMATKLPLDGVRLPPFAIHCLPFLSLLIAPLWLSCEIRLPFMVYTSHVESAELIPGDE